VRSFQESRSAQSSQTSIFGTTIEVDDDVPLLLEALGRVTKRAPDELVEGWALETAAAADAHMERAPQAQLSDEVRGKLAELLDLGETLFEETVSDAQRKIGSSYAEGDKAARAGADLFSALRRLLDLSDPDPIASTKENGANTRS
jgi:hypothetical protein